LRNFVLGGLSALIGLPIIGFCIIAAGLFPTNADSAPPKLERRVATYALNAGVQRHARRSANPLSVTDEDLISGMKLYTMNCAECHGSLDLKPSALAHSMYPPPPQLLLQPINHPEWQTYYSISTGIRYTAMPAWSHTLADKDIWQITAFLSRLRDLPLPVQQYWNESYGVSPAKSE
jgi:mono/diheme cytochrome c family protein